MGILLWIVFGAIAGWVASMIMRSENGLLWDVLLGIVGSVMGGFLMSLLGQPSVTGFNLYSFFVAILGAVVLIWIGRRLHIGYH
jgi:uncharacterized membrane protein YeaQ/YmgE (transglycosylase-associated protein family)